MSEFFSGAQALIRLRVTDLVSGLALPEAEVMTSLKAEEGDGIYRSSPFEFRNMHDGWFIMVINYQALVGKLRLGVATRFKFNVSLRGYEMAEELLLISADDFTAVSEEVVVGDSVIPRRRLRGAPFEQQIVLEPNPVRLAGLVVRDNDLDKPIENVNVMVNDDAANAVMTGGDGRFRFNSLPLKQTVDVTVSEVDNSDTTTHVIDFRNPINHLTLSLITESSD